MRKRTPEERERHRRLLEQSEAARRNMQEIIDRVEARRQAELERRARRWSRMRRLLRLGRAA
jgi:hypothetical protein